jgi:cobalt-zinc-cadmium efflux system membrane fusion protein
VKLSEESIRAYGVRVEKVARRVLTPTFVAPARVIFDPDSIAHVGSPVSGRVTEIKASVGDSVRKGDVLLVIQSPELGAAQAEFLQQRVAASSSAPSVELARKALERARSLHAAEAMALSEVQKREIELNTVLASHAAASSEASAAESRLKMLGMDQAALDTLAKSKGIDPLYRVRAPLSGQVVEREATLGELVDPEREALLVLADPTSTSGESTRHEGTTAFVSPSVDPATRTVAVRIEVKDPSARLRPGMFLRAEISSSTGEAPPAVIAVPEDAVQTVEGSPSVFVPVKGEKNTFSKRVVAIGPAVGGMVPVLSGLKEGQSIVASGSFILKAEIGKEGAAHEH